MCSNNIRHDEWKTDLTLKSSMEKYVREGLRRAEVLSFLKRDFPNYAWSLRTMDRRIAHFDIRRTNYNVTVDSVKEAVAVLSSPE